LKVRGRVRLRYILWSFRTWKATKKESRVLTDHMIKGSEANRMQPIDCKWGNVGWGG